MTREEARLRCIDILAWHILHHFQVGVSETDMANIPEDPDEDSEEGPSQLKIYFEGPNGEQKVFIIDYQ